MEITLRSTTKMVTLETADSNVRIPARIWEGTTKGGTPCHAYISRIACRDDADSAEFDRALEAHDPPTDATASIPLRLVL